VVHDEQADVVPTCGAASPTPRASRINWSIFAANSVNAGVNSFTGALGFLSRGSGNG
jgi:hypothetical protein